MKSRVFQFPINTNRLFFKTESQGVVLSYTFYSHLLRHQPVINIGRISVLSRADELPTVKQLLPGQVQATSFNPQLSHQTCTPSTAGYVHFVQDIIFANCVLIGEWESETDRVQGFGSMAARIPSSMGWIRMFLAIMVGVSALATTGVLASEFRLVWLAAGFSSLFLLLLDLTRGRWNQPNVRSMADIALMTPWLILLVRS